MATFHVYVEGPIEESAQAAERLARAMEARYGLPATELSGRIAKGRFRVKANCDRMTADTYVRDLESIGARALIEEIEDYPTGAATKPALSAPSKQSGPLTKPLGPAATPRPGAGQSTLPPAIARTGSKPEFASGLAAAFTSDAPAADLGALSGAAFSLSSIDGRPATEPPVDFDIENDDDGAGAEMELAAPTAVSGRATATASQAKIELSAAAGGATVPLPGIVKPPARPGASTPPAGGPRLPGVARSGPSTPPADRFAPPEASDEERPLELHADEVADQRRRASIPPATQPGVPVGGHATPASGVGATTSQPVPRYTPITAGRAPGGTAFQPQSETIPADRMPRWRFAAGVLVAVLVGFAPASMIGGIREHSAYTRVDRDLVAAQQAAVTPTDYASLDGLRAAALDKKHAAHRSIAITSILLWLATSLALAYVWFKRIPWKDRRTA